jgi:hypothetical protein
MLLDVIVQGAGRVARRRHARRGAWWHPAMPIVLASAVTGLALLMDRTGAVSYPPADALLAVLFLAALLRATGKPNKTAGKASRKRARHR